MKSNRVSTLLIAGVITGLLLFSFQSPAVCQQETPEQFIERVKKAIANDEWARASSGVKYALELNPKLPSALFVAAQVYWHEGARSAAIESLTKALEAQPFFPEAHLLLARCFKATSNFANARDEVNLAITQGTPPFPAYRLAAEIEFAAGNLDAAITFLETALRFSDEADPETTTQLRDQINQTREFAEKLKQFTLLEAGQKEPDVVRPVLLNNPQPRYTEEARRLKIQGAVSLGILVNESGDVAQVMVLRGLGNGLDEEAVEVARKLKFSPATKSNKPIVFWTRLSVEFNLR